MRQTTIVLLLSLVCGFISMSQEIYWFRIISYLTGGRPTVFSHVLAFFLLGLAIGAHATKRLPRNANFSALSFISAIMTAAAMVYYFAIPILAQVARLGEETAVVISYASILVVAALNGSVFPVLCDTLQPGKQSAGVKVSWVYLANIAGSTAGPLFTGFVLLEHFPIHTNVKGLTIGSLTFAVILALSTLHRRVRNVAVALTGIGVVLLLHQGLYFNFLERLQAKLEYDGESYKYKIENRSGIIAVSAGESPEMDTIYGSGVYDGRFSIDPVKNLNRIRRAYMFAALHPKPQDVLEIGLSSGTWARILAGHPEVQKLDIVEINPGYLDLMRHYPKHASLLEDSRLAFHVDDGRRYLKRHPDEKYDFILMNATFHWRSNMTNLLSEEFLRLCKSRLKAKGVLYYNSTDSADALYTAAVVFRHVALIDNVFIAASDSPFDMTQEERRATLRRIAESGELIFDSKNPASEAVLEELSKYPVEDLGDELRKRSNLIKVTDDNMATEYDGRIINEYGWGKLLFRSNKG